jgi:hypothetical protein
VEEEAAAEEETLVEDAAGSVEEPIPQNPKKGK